MGVTVQLHAPDALTLGNNPRNPLNKTLGVSQSRWWRFWKNKNILLYLPGIEPHILSRQAFGLVTIPATSSWPLNTELKHN